MILVCFLIATKVGNIDSDNDNLFFSREWKLASCYGPKFGMNYSSNEAHYDICCLTPGIYTLICQNTKSNYGWGNAWLEIEGERYCDDFVGFRALRNVSVKGIQKTFMIYLTLSVGIG